MGTKGTIEDVLESVEFIRSNFSERFDKIDERLDGIDGRLDKIENELQHINRELQYINRRLDSLEERTEGMKGYAKEIDELRIWVQKLDDKIKKQRQAV